MTFEDWLRRNHYRESSIRSTLQHVRRGQREGRDLDFGALPASVQACLRRFMTYADETSHREPLVKHLRAQGVQGLGAKRPAAKPKARLYEARSFSEDDWNALCAALSSPAVPEDVVLWIMADTGLRVGDVLRIPLRTLARGIERELLQLERKGGTFVEVPLSDAKPWRVLLHNMNQYGSENVADYVCPGNPNPDAGFCAYRRVSRRLHALGRDLGLQGRLNLHRLRRTVAVQALELTGDLGAVQQMLGHASSVSTQRYTDERRDRTVRELQQQLKEQRRK